MGAFDTVLNSKLFGPAFDVVPPVLGGMEGAFEGFPVRVRDLKEGAEVGFS